MSFIIREGKTVLPKVAATPINCFVPVKYVAGTDDQVSPVASGDRTLGLSIATVASANNPVAVQTEGVAKAYAAASLGAGALVSCATAGGQLGIAASGAQVVGHAEENAAAGAIFAVLLKPSTNTGAN